MDSRRSLPLLLLTGVLLLGACDQRSSGTLIKRDQKAPPAPAPKAGGVPDASRWEQLLAKVPRAEERQQKALDMLRDAQDTLEKSKAAAGPEAEKLRKEAGSKYAEAGTLYDELREECDELDERLWDRTFSSFQTKWDKLSRGLKRLNF